MKTGISPIQKKEFLKNKKHISIIGTFFFIFSIHFTGITQNTPYALLSNQDIIRISPTNCTYETILNGSTFPFNISFTDIAFEQGILYGCTGTSIYSIDLETGVITPLLNNDNVLDGNLCGLAGDNNGNLYASGHGFHRINIASGEIEHVGIYTNYMTQGDIEYDHSDFYVSAIDYEENSSLLRVGIVPFVFSEIAPLPHNSYGITKGGLASNEMYISTDSSLYIINLSSNIGTMICPNLCKNSIWGLTTGSDDFTNLKEETKANNINIFQDPTTQIITIKTSQKNAQLKGQLVNAMGQEILHLDLSKTETYIDMNPYPQGIYFVRFFNDGDIVLQEKVICY